MAVLWNVSLFEIVFVGKDMTGMKRSNISYTFILSIILLSMLQNGALLRNPYGVYVNYVKRLFYFFFKAEKSCIRNQPFMLFRLYVEVLRCRITVQTKFDVRYRIMNHVLYKYV